MNIRQETREELAAYLQAGRIDVGAGPLRLTLRHPPRANRGEPFEIAWRAPFAARVLLEMTTPSGRLQVQAVPRRGRRSIRPLRHGLFQFRLVAEPSATRRRRGVPAAAVMGNVEVVPPPPRIDAEIPRQAEAGEPLQIAWEVVEAVRISLEQNGRSHPIEARGERQLIFDRCGAQRLTIIAEGEGGRRRRDYMITVVAPPVVISAPHRVDVEAGDAARIDYRVSGATAVSLEMLGDPYPPFPVPASGRIETGLVVNSIHLRLTAFGRDGNAVARTITVVVAPIRFASIDDELNLLNGRL
jgi:hypothetical protein